MPEPITLVSLSGGVLGLVIHLARRYFEMAKEVMDVVLGFILLLACLPVMAVCALIVKVSSAGPVIFVQRRVGQGGKIFSMYKLRTMHLGAETGSGAIWAQENDPRVIPACKWMRRSHIDELPQLINVIKGEMSLVGPRPERPEILTKLEETYPEVRKRLTVRPGITGLAQIRHGYDTTIGAARNKVVADLEYIERRRWSLELRILAATIVKLNDKGAH